MRKWISRILFVVSIILLSISLYFFMGMYLEDRKSEAGFDNIRQIYEKQEEADQEDADNLIIYGHHMSSGKMFAALDQYKSKEFFQEHPIIQYSTLHGEEQYQIIAAFATPVYTGHDFEYYSFTKAEGAEEYMSFVEECKKRSYYDTGYTAQYGDKLITLSTCEYSHKNGRMVVVGCKINTNELN